MYITSYLMYQSNYCKFVNTNYTCYMFLFVDFKNRNDFLIEENEKL